MKDNHGFSLIELIIVIAIMAIAIGVIAPQLIKYIEKSNVSSDTQLADTIRTAVSTSIIDAEVVNDPDSQPYLALMQSSTGMNINSNTQFLNSDCVLKTSLETSFGFTIDQIMTQIRSKHGNACNCNVKVSNGSILVTLTCTDRTGKGDTSLSSPENDIQVD